MGRRGPAPKPTTLKKLEGNPGKRPLNKREPMPLSVRPACPQYLHPIAKKEWRRVVPELERLGILTVVDGTALETYCQAYANMVQAATFVNQHGMIFKTPQGCVQQLPQVAIFNKSALIVKAFCQEFGLTPSARGRMVVPGSEDDDEGMESLLEGGSTDWDIRKLKEVGDAPGGVAPDA